MPVGRGGCRAVAAGGFGAGTAKQGLGTQGRAFQCGFESHARVCGFALHEQLLAQQFMRRLDRHRGTEIERQRFVAAGGATYHFHAAVQLALLDGQQAAEVVLEDAEIARRLRIIGGPARCMQRGECRQRFLRGRQVVAFDGGIAIDEIVPARVRAHARGIHHGMGGEAVAITRLDHGDRAHLHQRLVLHVPEHGGRAVPLGKLFCMLVSPGHRGFDRLLAGLQHAVGVAETALLVIGVFQPLRVMIAFAQRAALGLGLGVDDVHRHFVGFRHVVPHAKCHEDVRGHVLCMAGIRGNLRQGPCRLQRTGGVRGIVHCMDPVVRRAGILRVEVEDALGDRSRAQVSRHVAHALAAPHQCQRMEQLCVVVTWIVLGQAFHRLVVMRVAERLCVAARIQDFHGGKIGLFARRRCLGRAGSGRGTEPAQCRATGIRVELVPDAVVVRHRLAPVGHGEVRIQLLGLAESLRGIGIFEQVQQQRTAQERSLRSGRTGRRRERNRAEPFDAAHRFGRARL